MRAIGHCSTHPSREARLRCRSCRRWLCDRCVRVIAGHLYCGRACWARDLRDRAVAAARRVLRSRMHPAWVATVVTAACVVLATAVGVLIDDLLELGAVRGEAAREADAEVVARWRRDDGEWLLELSGRPGSRWLLRSSGGASIVVDLAENGRAVVPGSGLAAPLQLFSTSAPRIVVAPSAPAPAAAEPPPAEPSVEAPAPAAPEAVGARPPRPDGAKASPVAPPILHLVPDAGRRIALTFDGGMSANGTVDFLDVLARTGLEVTLFLTGQFIEREPALVRRAVLAGHEVGNHTYSHPHLTSYGVDHVHRLLPEISEAGFREELERSERAFFAATGRRMAPLWRSPYGEENGVLRGWAFELGYLHVRWSSLSGASLDSRDWVADEHSPMYQESSRMIERLLGFPRLEGGIVLMHLATERDDPPWNGLPDFVRRLGQRGIRPVKVTELLAASPTWRRWLERARARHQEVWGAE